MFSSEDEGDRPLSPQATAEMLQIMLKMAPIIVALQDQPALIDILTALKLPKVAATDEISREFRRMAEQFNELALYSEAISGLVREDQEREL